MLFIFSYFYQYVPVRTVLIFFARYISHPNFFGKFSSKVSKVIMDIIKAVQLYLDKIVAECGPGMKVLLMDKETVRFYLNTYNTTYVSHL